MSERLTNQQINNPDAEQHNRQGHLVVASRGEESLKAVDNKIQRTIPFVGADRPGEFSSMGVGLMLPEKGGAQIWGLVMPHQLIQSWRAMKILEHVEQIDHGTLCATWYAAARDVREGDQRYLDELSTKIGTRFQALRNEVLGSAPLTDELESMLKTLSENDVEFDTWELKAEIEAGRIISSPVVDGFIAQQDKKTQEFLDEYSRQEEELKKPIEDGRSIAKFLGDLGFDEFLTDPDGWGYETPGDLEQVIRRHSYYSKGYEPLLYVGKDPKSKKPTGKLENPSFVADNGVSYKLKSARYLDGDFFVQTEIKEQGKEPEKVELSIQQLREELKELLEPKKENTLSRLFRTLRRS